MSRDELRPRTDYDDPALYESAGMKPQCTYIVRWHSCRLDAGHPGKHSPGRTESDEGLREALTWTNTTEAREALRPIHLRGLGIASTLMSDFELFGALERDHLWTDQRSGNDHLDMACYDRRGLLNVIAALAAHPAPAGLDVERLARLLRDHCHDSADEGPPLLLRHDHLAPFIRDDCAAAIATAYARLAAGSADE